MSNLGQTRESAKPSLSARIGGVSLCYVPLVYSVFRTAWRDTTQGIHFHCTLSHRRQSEGFLLVFILSRVTLVGAILLFCAAEAGIVSIRSTLLALGCSFECDAGSADLPLTSSGFTKRRLVQGTIILRPGATSRFPPQPADRRHSHTRQGFHKAAAPDDQAILSVLTATLDDFHRDF